MKNAMKCVVALLLAISFSVNGILVYYINETKKTKPSIVKLNGSDSDTVIYCERSEKDHITKIDNEEHSVTVGSSKILTEGTDG